VVFPELTISGYPPEDLLLKRHFIKENIKCLDKIAASTEDIIVIVGFVDSDRSGIYNSAGVLSNKKIAYKYHKINLPNYGVFDEKRYFRPGSGSTLLKSKDFSFCVNICEDIWVAEYDAERRILEEAQFLVNISASPYHLDKIKQRQDILVKKIKKFRSPIVYCNLIGGQDELVFDGRSIVYSRDAEIIAKAKAFEEDLFMVDLALNTKRMSNRRTRIKSVAINYRAKEKKKILPLHEVKDMTRLEEVYSALVLGVRDYVRKNNFEKVTFGLSGGIDSALVACIAVDALSKANVLAVSMPSKYSSRETQADAEKISRNLGIRFAKVSIDTIFDAYNDVLRPHFMGMNPDITEENIQARIRGNILMAFSNKFGYLVLNTGNKSETSVGYCTLYGDMAGGFAVIKDVPKKLVYELAEFVNKSKEKEIIPRSVFKRAPSAELRSNQKDQDTLPPYGLLDETIDLYIEKDKSFNEIVKKLGKKELIKKILRMIDGNEYKRRQAPPGIKITPRSFGKDRRMPIINRYSEVQYARNDT
jgi:NAD+ synthase (glutamine-hydrolysing)